MANESKGFLADSFGKHVVSGILAEYSKDTGSGSEPIVKIHQLLGRGEWDALELVTYEGAIIDPANYTFHPGISDPATDSRFPDSLRHAGIARLTLTLPDGMAADGDPSKVKVIARTRKLNNYSADDGSFVSNEYSTNPADQFVEIVAENCRRLGLPLVDFVDWEAYGDARSYYGTGIVQADYNRYPRNFRAGRTTGGSLATGLYYVSVVATGTDPDVDYSLRAGEAAVSLTTGNQTLTASWDAVAGATAYRVWVKSPDNSYGYYDTASLSINIGAGGTLDTPPTGAGGEFTITRPRFESHVFFDSPTSMEKALNSVLWQCASDYQRVGKRYKLLTPQTRPTVHTLNPSNTMPGSFRFWREPGRPNRVTAEFRNVTHEDLKQADPLSINRETTQALVGVNEEAVQFFSMSPNQAYRLINWRIRTEHDLSQRSTVQEDGTGSHILPGDVVEFDDAHANWTNKKFLVVDREADQSDSAVNLTLGLREYDPDAYSDDDSAPIQSTQPVEIPSRFTAPPEVAAVTLTQTTETKNEGTVVLGVSAVVEFAANTGGGRVRGLVYHKKPGGSFEYLYAIEPDAATGNAGFRVENLALGTHEFRVLVVSSAGIQQSGTPDTYSISIVAKAAAVTAPSSLTAAFDGIRLLWTWTASPDSDVKGYNIYTDADAFITFVQGTQWSERLIASSTGATRKVKAVNTTGVESSAVSYAYTVAAPSHPGSGAGRRVGSAIRWEWAASSSNSVSHYLIEDEAGNTLTITPGLVYEEAVTPGKTSYVRSVYAVDYVGTVSSSSLTMTHSPSEVPAAPSNYYVEAIGRSLRHTWGAAPVNWTVTSNSVVDSDNGVRRSGGLTGFTTGARTSEALTGDGFVEWVLTSTNETLRAACGLTKQAGTMTTLSKADYCAAPKTTASGKQIEFYYQGTLQATTSGTWAAGDVLRLAIENGAVKVYQNGTLRHTFSQVISYPITTAYNGCCLLNSTGATVKAFRMLGNSHPVAFEISRASNFSDVVFRGFASEYLEPMLPGDATLANRTIARYIRALNAAGNASSSSVDTGTIYEPGAPTVTEDAANTHPNAVTLHVSTVTPKDQILSTLVQIKPDGGSYPADTFAGTDGNIRFAGCPDEVVISYAPGGSVEIRVAHEDVFTEELLDHQWSTDLLHTFPLLASDHIQSLKVGKIEADDSTPYIIFADAIGSENFIASGDDATPSFEESMTIVASNGGDYIGGTASWQKTAADGWNAGFTWGRAAAYGACRFDFTMPYANNAAAHAAFGIKNGKGALTSYTEILFGIQPASSYYVGTPNVYIFESGNIHDAATTWTIGDVFSIVISGSGVVTYFKNGVLIHTSIYTHTKYPAYPCSAVYHGGQVLPDSMMVASGYLQDTNGIKPRWKNRVGVALSQDSDDNLTRTAASSGWGGSGAFSVESLSEDGYLEFSGFSESSGMYQCVGLSTSDTNASWDTINYAFLLGTADLRGPGEGFWVSENGSQVYTYNGAITADDVFRVSRENGAIKYRFNGTVVYTNNSPTSASLYADSSIYAVGTKIRNIRLGNIGSRGAGWKCTPDGDAEFATGVTIAGSRIGAIQARSINAISESNRYRGNDKAAPLENRITEDMIALGNLRTVETDIYTELIINLDEAVLTDTYANFDSVKLARVRLYNIFGEVVNESEQAFGGRGKFVVGFTERAYCDPIELAVFSVEFQNAYGWSRPVYWTAAGVWTSPSYWNWSGNGTVNPPPWRIKSDFPTTCTAYAIDHKSIKLNWTPPATNTEAGSAFAVWIRVHQKGKVRSAWVLAAASPTITSSTNTYTITDYNIGGTLVPISPNTEYEVMAHGGGAVQWSNICHVRTLPLPPAALPTRAAPSGLTGRADSQTQITLEWSRNATDNTDVEVYRDGTLYSTESAAVVSKAVTGLTAGVTYRFAVRNKWSSGTTYSDFSNEIEITAPVDPLPSANDPSGLTGEIVGDGDTVYLTWTKNSGSNARVERSSDGVTWSTLVSGLGSTTTYTDTPGYNVRRYYRVFNATSGANYSNVLDIRTLPRITRDPDGGFYTY